MIKSLRRVESSLKLYNKRKKEIQEWDFIMVFQQSFEKELFKFFSQLKCQDKLQWKFIQNTQDKQILVLMKLSQEVVDDEATKLKILKKKNKKSYELTLSQINTNKLRFKSQNQGQQGNVNMIFSNYLDFIKARLQPGMQIIYEQEQYSAFNKKKKDHYIKQGQSLFTPQQELRAKYNFLLTYSEIYSENVSNDIFKFLSKIIVEEKPNQTDYRSTLEQASNMKTLQSQRFIYIMGKKEFKELVPIHRTSLFRPIQFKPLKGYLGSNQQTYFDFLAFFQRWLIFPMIIGILTIAVNFFGNYTADNSPVDFIYAFFIMIWSILFITKWEQNQNWAKIKQASGYNDYWSQYQRTVTKGDLAVKNSSITGLKQYYLPLKKKLLWFSVSYGIMGFIIFLTMIWMVMSLNARGFVDRHHKLIYFDWISNWAAPGGIFDANTYWAQIPNVVHVLVTNIFDEKIYRPIARKLALIERHNNQKSYENSIIWKFFIYEFIITFVDLFYIAFVRFDIDGLRQQLVSLFIIDILRRLVAQTLIPWVNKKWVSSSIKKSEKIQENSPQQLKYSAILQTRKQSYEPFDDYLQIITNFGYLVMISSCFPIAPALIVVAHFVQNLQDKYKITYIFKRKLPKKYVGMGSWKAIILFLCYFSIVTNIMLFAFSSEQIVTYLPILYEGGKDVLYGNKFISDIINSGGTQLVSFFNLDELVRFNSHRDNTTEDDGWGDFWSNKQLKGVYKNESNQSSIGKLLKFDNFLGNKDEKQQQNQNNQKQEQKPPNQRLGGLGLGNLLSGKPTQKPPDSQDKNNQKGFNPGNMFKTFAKNETNDQDIVNLQTYRPPSQQHQATFIIVLFVLQHIFLGIFLWLRYYLSMQVTQSDIFLKRRQYKRRIKKHLPDNFIEFFIEREKKKSDSTIKKQESKSKKFTEQQNQKQLGMKDSKSTTEQEGGISKLISSMLVSNNEDKQEIKKDQ